MPLNTLSHSPPATPASWVLTPLSVALLLLAFGLVWSGSYALTAFSPGTDNIEQLVWVRSLEWGYYKHPPLTTWLLGAAAAVFGPSVGLTYVLGTLVTLAALGLFWALLRSLRGAPYATLATLAALCITFYNGRLYYFNHNVVLTLWVACAVVLTWRVTQRPQISTWVLLGLVSGLGLLTKYQFVLALAAMGLWWLHLRGWRHPIHRQGALWAAVCTLAVCAPHFHWLQTQGWMPFAYARSASLGAALEGAQRVGVALEFTLDWWLNRALPAWLLLWCALGWRRSAPSPNDAATPARPGDESQVRAFLLCWAVVPWACMVVLGLGWGVALEPHWGTPFALWTVAGVLELLRRWRPLGRAPQLRRAWLAFAVIQTLLLAQFLAASPVGLPNYKASHQNRFPAQHLAQQIAPAARQALGGPIDILVGPQFLAGNIAVHLPEQPRVLVDGHLRYSPWIQAEELATARVLEVAPLPPPEQLQPGGWQVYQHWAWRPWQAPAPQ